MVSSPVAVLNAPATKTGMKQTVARGKYTQLLNEDQQVRRWYDNVCRGSKVTADVYIRRLGAICSKRNTSPAEMIKKNKEDEGEWLYNFLMDLVTDMEREGNAGSYISCNLKAVKSWLSHNGIEFKRKIKIRGVEDTPTLREKHTLNTNQLRELFQGSPPETRCLCALMAHAGLRPVSIGNYAGTDGLCVGDITDMQIGADGVVTFLNIPAMVTVRRELSKAGHQYFTFLSREACEYLQEYLMQRIRSGEVLDASSPLVAPEKSRIKKFLRASMGGKLVRKRLRECKINARPYDLAHIRNAVDARGKSGSHHEGLPQFLHGAQGRHREQVHHEQAHTAPKCSRGHASKLFKIAEAATEPRTVSRGREPEGRNVQADADPNWLYREGDLRRKSTRDERRRDRAKGEGETFLFSVRRVCATENSTAREIGRVPFFRLEVRTRDRVEGAGDNLPSSCNNNEVKGSACRQRETH